MFPSHADLVRLLSILKKYKLKLVFIKNLETYVAAVTIEYPYDEVPYLVIKGFHITAEVTHFDPVVMKKKLEKLFEENDEYVNLKFPSHVDWTIVE
jgi:hypothetical protein